MGEVLGAMDTPIRLSVVSLTKNEAGRIRECIESVRWAEEVLVIDDESTDDTVAIARSLGARVLLRRMDIEGRHRNWAYAQAKHEWILSLDADEQVTPALAQEVRELLTNSAAFDVYAIPRRNFIGQRWIRHGGWYPSPQVKLFKRSIFRWEETTVHPRAISNRPAGSLRGDLLHFSYRDLTDFVEKLNRHTTLEAEKWLRDGRRMSLGKAVWRAIDRWWRTYIAKRGFRDGFWGWVVAVMAGMYQLIAWAKSTEVERGWRVEDVVEPFGSLVRDGEHYDRPLLMSHLCAYRLAARLGRQGRFLEIGGGTGYGAFYLGHVARAVVAIDLNRAQIERARRIFRRPNVQYLSMEGTRLAFADHSFDAVGSFQVIEHVPEDRLAVFLREIARVLVPGGVFVVSTLNLDHNRKNNPRYQKPSFHEKEFTPEEFRTLLSAAFADVQVSGLYPRPRYRCYRRLKKWGLDRWGPPRWNPVRRFFEERLDTDAFVLRPRCDTRAIDLIGVCRTRPADNGAPTPREGQG